MEADLTAFNDILNNCTTILTNAIQTITKVQLFMFLALASYFNPEISTIYKIFGLAISFSS
jgi:hypothetical protein